MNEKLKKFFPHLIAILIFYAVSIFCFFPQFNGQSVRQGDIISWKGMAQEAKAYHKETGVLPLWTNSMFSGMPGYQIYAPQQKNVFKYVEQIFQGGLNRPAGYFFYGMLAFYIMMIALGVSPWLSILGSIGFILTSNHFVLFEAGHTSKLRAIMSSAIIIAGVITAYRKNIWIGSTLFLIGMGVNIVSNHVQMSYYLALALIIYVLFELYHKVKDKDFKSFIKPSLGLLLALGLAAGTSTSKLWTTQEYGEDTMRGKPILKTTSDVPQSSSETKGLEWNYAMNWSNGWIDLLAGIIPGAVGGSSSEPIKSSSATAKEFRKYGVRSETAPLYWGPLPGTSGPVYYGAILIFLFLFSAIYLKGPIKYWLVSAVVLTLLLSLGKHFALNRIIFDYLPLYNKFRSPSSVTSITAILIPLLGILGLHRLSTSNLKNPKPILKKLWISGGITGGFCLAIFLFGPSLFSFEGLSDARLSSQGFDTSSLIEDRKSLLRADSIRSLIFILLAIVCIWAMIKSYLRPIYMAAILGILVVVDLLPIGKRYLNNNDFVSSRVINQSFVPRPVDQQILADQDPHYRVLDLSIDPFNSSKSSYYHKTIGGYHAAKLQRYQDLIERHISQNNQRVLNMLNMKYLIQQQANGQLAAQRNPGHLGNAWFVNSARIVANANEEIDALADFDPLGEAILHREFQSYIQDHEFEKNGAINLTNYAPHRIEYRSNATSDQLAVFSEVWYGPNKGWQAYIDGEPMDHIRANYALRALLVPAGQHDIVFEFNPRSYKTGEIISLVFSILSILFILGSFFWWYKSNSKN